MSDWVNRGRVYLNEAANLRKSTETRKTTPKPCLFWPANHPPIHPITHSLIHSLNKDAYAALRIPDYRRFLGMRMMTTLAIQIMSVSVGYFVYDLTHDPLMRGLIGLAEAIPAIGISLWAGHMADKHNRRNILAGCILVLLTCSLALLTLASLRDTLPKQTLLAGIYAVIFCTGISRGFFSPTNFAFLPQLDDKKILPNAITWNSSTWEVASITGLGLGGLLYGFAGVTYTFAAMATLCLLAMLAILSIEPRPVPPADHSEPAVVRIREGLRFVFSNQLILSAIALDLFAVLRMDAPARLDELPRHQFRQKW